VLARCPSCRNTFSTDRPGRQDCPICAKPLIVPEPAAAVPAHDAAARAEEPAGTPWERRGELGFWTGWLQTLQQALLVLGGQREQMRRLVESMSRDRDLGPMLRRMIDVQTQASSPGWVVALVVLTPLFSLVFLYLNAAVTHGVAALLGQARRGFPATFAACAYACAPLALLAVPACGSIVGVLWLIVLTAIGMKITHRISAGGAAASVLAPYLVLCCVLFVAFGAMALALRGALGQP